MRKIKKINGFLVVKFNDREKREYEGTALGEYGVIDAEVYTGNLDIDRGAMEYDDADTLEVAVELARGLESEEDITDEPPTYTAAVETNESYTEEAVEPTALIEGWTRRLATQVKSKHHPDADPRTAAHELYGFKMALHQIGFLPESEVITDPDTFGAGRLDGPMPRNPEELLAFVCDERCKNRAGHTQEELDAICAKCPLGQLYEDAEAQDLRIRERSERALQEHIEGVRRAEDTVTALLGGHEALAYTEIRTQVGVLEVNFCINGRFETSFSMRSHVLLKPGDMAISCYDGLHGTKSESHFPLGYYEGLCLEIDPAAAGHWIRLNAPAFPIDFTALKQNLLGSKWYMVGPAGPRCEHVFRELYESASYAERGFLQLKVLELMLLLGRIPQERAADPYCSAEQTALAHHLRDHLLTNREGYVSLAQLAAEHAISVSHLQKLFKQTYGMPVYHYIKEYRLEQAAVELVRSRKPITEIAQHAGYDNTSKFSESFKKRYGKTPSRYRADKTNAVKRSIETKTE